MANRKLPTGSKNYRENGIFQIVTNKVTKMKRPIEVLNDIAYSASTIDLRDEQGKEALASVIFDASFKEKYCSHPLPDHKPISEAPFKFEIDNLHELEGSLSAKAYVAAVLSGETILDPKTNFDLIKKNIDHFVSFDGAFSSQEKMCSFCALWIMATYAIEVQDTTSYLWCTGEKASGKSQGLKTFTQMAFGGTILTSSSTFASLRDLANTGATLAFDDCENVKNMDHNKRELILAGNTKGVMASLKVPAQGGRDNDYQTKKVNGFAPRAFSSIGLPDAVLGSRSVLINFTRSSDGEKTRRKPSNQKDWPTSPQEIRDVTWLNVVKYLKDIEAAKELVNDSSTVAGRDFDIFQGPLMIAAWLEFNHGANGLLDETLATMDAYLAERDKYVMPSLEALLMEALVGHFSPETGNSVKLYTNEIATSIRILCDGKDITDEALAEAGNQRIGQLLGRLNFESSGTHGSRRGWIINRGILEQHCNAHGIHIAPPMETPMPDWAFEENRTKWEEDITVPEDEKPW